MPGHVHGNIRAVISAEKFIEFIAPVIELFFWRLDVDRVFAETIRGFTRIAFVPTIRDGLHESFKFGFCHRGLIFVSSSDTETLRRREKKDSAALRLCGKILKLSQYVYFHFASETM